MSVTGVNGFASVFGAKAFVSSNNGLKGPADSTVIQRASFYGQNDVESQAYLAWANDCSPAATGNESGKSFEDWVAQRQTEGVGTSFDWNILEYDIKSSISDATRSLEDGIEILDGLAARYAVMRSRMEEVLSGQELADSLSRLDTLFDEAIADTAERMSTAYADALESYGITGEKEKIRDSLLAIYDSAKDNYSSYISNNNDYMGVRGTEDEWHMSLDRLAAASLQGAANSKAASSVSAVDAPATAKEPEALYTNTELKALAGILSGLDDFKNFNILLSEEELGFKLGDMAARINFTSSAIGAGDMFDSLTKNLFNNFIDVVIDDANRRIDGIRTMPYYTAVDHTNEAYMDKDTVMSIYNTMMDAYESGKGMEEVWRVGLEAGRESYDNSRAKENMYSTVRYGSGYGQSSFFANFYETTISYTKVSPTSAPATPNSQREALVWAWENMLSGLGINSPFNNAGSVMDAYA